VREEGRGKVGVALLVGDCGGGRRRRRWQVRSGQVGVGVGGHGQPARPRSLRFVSFRFRYRSRVVLGSRWPVQAQFYMQQARQRSLSFPRRASELGFRFYIY
jgi:hypothetical protein